MQMRQRDVCALDAKYTKGQLMLKLKMMLCVMMLPLVVVSCTSKQSVSQCVLHTASGVDVQPPPTGRHRCSGLHPSERLITFNNWKEPGSILIDSADRVAHIDGQLVHYVSNTHALLAGINA